MSAMLGVIEPSLAGRPMMVLLQEHADVCIGPNVVLGSVLLPVKLRLKPTDFPS
jgi:hypothetical protein